MRGWVAFYLDGLDGLLFFFAFGVLVEFSFAVLESFTHTYGGMVSIHSGYDND